MSNDAYYQSRTAGVYGGTISLLIIAAIAVVLRLTARRISAANFWWDDWTLVIALVSLAGPWPPFSPASHLSDIGEDFGLWPKRGLLGPG